MKENDRGTGHIPLLAYYGGHENGKPVYLSERGDKCADRKYPKVKLPPCSKRDQAASSKKDGTQDIAVYVPSGEAGRRFQEP